MRIIAAAALLCLTGQAVAHDWYPAWCCSDTDCAPIHESRVKALPTGGYLVDGRFTVPQAEVKYSPDGQYHACFPQPGDLRCFFAPPQGS